MLVALRRADRKRSLAREEARNDGPWVCPDCDGPLVIHKGNHRVHHFAHKAKGGCEYGRAESQDHYACKIALYDILRAHPAVSFCEVEHRGIAGSRPDVFFVTNGTRVAVEVQRSDLTEEAIARRTAAYSAGGVFVVWICLWSKRLEVEKFSPSAWEKWLHQKFRGRVYYWKKGVGIVPVHFGDHMIEVPYRTWYDSDGTEQSAGGYEKYSHRYRTPRVAPSAVDIIDGMHAQHLYTKRDGKTVADGLVWMDRLSRWWLTREELTERRKKEREEAHLREQREEIERRAQSLRDREARRLEFDGKKG